MRRFLLGWLFLCLLAACRPEPALPPVPTPEVVAATPTLHTVTPQPTVAPSPAVAGAWRFREPRCQGTWRKVPRFKGGARAADAADLRPACELCGLR